MSGWRECRVVRDKDGDLWGCDGPGPKAYWTGLGSASEVDAWQSDALDRWYGPLTPILDADGLPMVRTVGDLTARHIGKRVRVEGWGETVFREVFPTESSARCVFADRDHEFVATIGIPCELLPEGDA